ncbi:MAG TPA: AMP-binding protein [Verrucomicrobiae bacterium]|nr:AMP-binding protein [Verrucomicrobiae bacterium]
MSANLPLIRGYEPQAPLLLQAGSVLSQAQFLGACDALAQRMPATRHVVNLCEDRGAFMHAFAAACWRGQTSLLPQSRVPGVVREVAAMYPGCAIVTDTPFEDVGLPQLTLGALDASPWPGAAPEIPEAHVAAIAFTSGSTGTPQPNPKSWRNLFVTAGMCAERFLGARAARHSIVATVPPQHMYGLEASVMLALGGGCSTHEGRPFFPDDVRAALATVPAPRLLVTTPVHLRSLAGSKLSFPPIARVISATAPLSAALAAHAESQLAAEVHEIYGCTEAGSMCTRRTLDGERWLPYPQLRMHHHEGMTHVAGPHLDQPVATPDVIEAHDDGSITLLGRAADMIKVAGKRASLVQLTGRLLAVPGVEDGVVFLPAEAGDHARIAALVVAPGMTEQQVLRALADLVDPVFLPRPLRCVEQLPRNALGKLPRAELLALLEQGRG